MRRMSSSSRRPTCLPTLLFATVVILSTVRRDGLLRPLVAAAVSSPFAGSAIAQLAADDVYVPALLAHPNASRCRPDTGFKPRAPATQEREGSVELWLALTGRSPAICVHSAPPTVLKCSVSTRAHPIYD